MPALLWTGHVALGKVVTLSEPNLLSLLKDTIACTEVACVKCWACLMRDGVQFQFLRVGKACVVGEVSVRQLWGQNVSVVTF